MKSHTIDAIYCGGVLKPLGEVPLNEDECVHLTIERMSPRTSDRELALDRLRAGIREMKFSLAGSLPARDELHDRI